MRKPMRIKIFAGDNASAIAQQINPWLGSMDSAMIIKTETAIGALAGRANDGGAPFIVVMYEPPEKN